MFDLTKMEPNVENLKMLIREDEYPFFAGNDDKLQFFIDHTDNFSEAVYQACIYKAENSEMEMSGYKSQDTSQYFKMLAQQFRQPRNTPL